jgi:phage replication-related protein YjqB (UPF0714/DUF867 family)
VKVAALVFLVGCAMDVGSVDTVDEAEETVETVPIAASADSFACVRPESPSTVNGGYSCAGSPSLIFSTLCTEGQSGSYHVSTSGSAPDMTMAVIAPHGGWIEPNTDEIALGLAADLGLPHFVFIAHATASCLDKYGGPDRSNHRALHITSTHFNDARAETLMRSVNRGLAIHGHGGNNKICVGGATPALRTAFKSYYDTNTKQYSPSQTSAVIATSDADCTGITGTAAANISNRSRTGAGLQLEMSSKVRSELVASMNGSDRRFWTSFRNAVRAACRVNLGGVSGC